MSVIDSGSLQLNLPLPFLLVILHFAHYITWSDRIQLGCVFHDIFIIKTVFVLLILVFLIRYICSL